jgi:hypothetical protein
MLCLSADADLVAKDCGPGGTAAARLLDLEPVFCKLRPITS